jgi:hypothetical protein
MYENNTKTAKKGGKRGLRKSNSRVEFSQHACMEISQ